MRSTFHTGGLVRSAARAACALAPLTVLVGCDPDDHDAAKEAVRRWSAAVNAGDTAACRWEHPDFQADLSSSQAAGQDCADRVERRLLDAPSPGDELAVAVWDPSGEALVEARTAGDDTSTVGYWLVRDGDRWLVAGLADDGSE